MGLSPALSQGLQTDRYGTPAPVAATPPAVEEVLVTAPEPRFVAPTTWDRIGRVWAPVMINGQGPFRLVLDTGASRSAITRAVVDELGLPIRPEPSGCKGQPEPPSYQRLA